MFLPLASKVKYPAAAVPRMLLSAVAEETYCLRTQEHTPVASEGNLYCYRCGMYLGHAKGPALGSLLDY
jgi:hypothetical protein